MLLFQTRRLGAVAGFLSVTLRASRTSREQPLLGRFGVADTCCGQPDGATGIVDAVPKPASSGDLVLPLLQFLPVDDAPGERAS